ncbi:hypothetical protein [uncultured Roseibium sp.]|uniref:hypothetical protein n=1 Tax=uncultured Roseibium sp. TaxID=1936171 RepID=UPI002609A4B2|nr:hypothetical protein [uncultured Roseibium sp.]
MDPAPDDAEDAYLAAEGAAPDGPLPPVLEPVVGVLLAAPVFGGVAVLPADLASTFSAFRSMVTGRFELAEDALALPDEDLAAPLSPEAPSPLDPLPPEEDVPSEDFLSVAISFPPEPNRFQDLHYTHLFAKRYRCAKVFCALQKNDSPGSG